MKWKQSVALLLAASCVMLTACRESEVIQNVILTQDASEVDDTEVLDSNQQEQIDEMAQFVSEKQKDETKSNPDDVKNTAKEGEDISDSAAGRNLGNSVDDGSQRQVSDGGSADVAGDSTKSGEPSPDEEDETEDVLDGEEETPDPEEEGKGKNSGGRLADDPNARQIYDEDGNVIDLPEHVSSVAAPSDIGLIVQMLGGAGMLKASSSDFLSNSLAQQVFADESFSEITQLWSGDGSGGMSDSDFQKLLEMHPDCCIIYNGGSNLSDDQVAKLKEADIPVVPVPKLSTAENIEQTVLSVGQALGDNTSKGGLNSQQLAVDYVKYEQKLLTQVSGKNGISTYLGMNFYDEDALVSNILATEGTYSNSGKATLYIDGWDDAAYIRGTDQNVLNQSGIAVIHKDYVYHAMSWYLGNAGVIDAVSACYYTGDLYLNPLRNEGAAECNFPSYLTLGGNYFNPYRVFYVPYVNLGNLAYAELSNYLGFLGEDTYPAVLVSSQAIYDKLYASQYSAAGLYRPGDEGEGLLYRKWSGSEWFGTEIFGNYDIYINPCGVGSWADGSVEGFLEAVWASSKFYGSYSENEVNEKIKDFYRTFYRHELTDAQLADILDGL